MRPRDGTCVTDYWIEPFVGPGVWRSTCGHAVHWRLGDLKAACEECVGARCSHVKYGVDVEQGRML